MRISSLAAAAASVSTEQFRTTDDNDGDDALANNRSDTVFNILKFREGMS